MSQSQNIFDLLKNEDSTNRIIILILLSYPSLLLTVRGSMGVLFFILLLLSLNILYQTRNSHPLWDKYSIAFALSMGSPVLAIFLSQAYHGEFSAPYYDWSVRFLLAVPIFLALRKINIRVLSVLQYGVPIGALTGLAMLKLHPYDWGGHYTTSIYFNLIHFSDTALILGFLSLFSISLKQKVNLFGVTLKIGGFLAGIYMSIQSGERGGWLAIPLLLLIWVAMNIKERRLLILSLAALFVISVSWLSYAKIDVVHYRIEAVFSNLKSYSQGGNSRDTSIGIRLQLYLAAWHLFVDHPIFGIGPGGFADIMPELISKGELTPAGGVLGTSEVHNEILAKCAETGVFGLISIFSIYFVPWCIFWRTTKSQDFTNRTAALMGFCLVTGFFIFGLTVEIFDLKMTAAFYALTLTVLLAAATNKSKVETLNG